MIRRLHDNIKRFLTVNRAKSRTAGRTTKQKREKEQYSVIIASETDARKKTFGFLVTRRAVFAAAGAAILAVVAFVVLTISSVLQSSYYSAKSNELKNKIAQQSTLIDTYADEIDTISSDLNNLREGSQPTATE